MSAFWRTYWQAVGGILVFVTAIATGVGLVLLATETRYGWTVLAALVIFGVPAIFAWDAARLEKIRYDGPEY